MRRFGIAFIQNRNAAEIHFLSEAVAISRQLRSQNTQIIKS